MPQKYKVYINDRVIIFRKSEDTQLKNGKHVVYIAPPSNKINEIVDRFKKKKKVKKLFLITDDPKALFTIFALDYKIVKAAGGVVRNHDGALLMIFRKGKWDLPKGKKNKGEKNRQTALREVSEETGIKNLTITKKLESTYHTYKEKKKQILKKTYWYEMFSEDEQLIPQTEEDITEVKWIKPNELDEIMKNTFRSVGKVLWKYRKEMSIQKSKKNVKKHPL